MDRETVVRAAADLLDQNAGQEITLTGLAAKLGVRAPSLYNHIAGLDDLYDEIALFGTRELGRRIGRAAIGKSGGQAIMAIAGAYRAFAKERPGLYLATLRAPSASEAARTVASDEILAILRLVLQSFVMAPETEIHAMRALRSLMHGFVSLELIGGFGIPVDVDESFDYLLTLIDVALRQHTGEQP